MRAHWILLVISGLVFGGLGVDGRAQAEVGGLVADFLASEQFKPEDEQRRILRTDFDLTGDGIPEAFLSRSASWTRNGFRWRVYELGGDGSFRDLGSTTFNQSSVRVTGPDALRVLEPRAVGRWWMVDYRLVSGTLAEVGRRELSEGVELEEETIREEQAAMRQFWQERDIPWAWAQLSEGGTLTSWRSAETNEVIPGLQPIPGVQPGLPSASRQSGQTSLLKHLHQHRPCSTSGCEIFLELRDVTGDQEAELLLSTSSFTGSPHLVYARGAQGLSFLGELPRGLWRLDKQGRLLLLRTDPTVLEAYRVSPEGVVRMERTAATTDPRRVESERQRMAKALIEEGSAETRFRVPWEQASSNPSNVDWVTFRTREPSDVNLELSTAVTVRRSDPRREK